MIGYLYYVLRMLASSGGKHCKLLEVIVKGKVISMFRKRFWRDKHFFAIVLSQIDLGMVDIKLNLIIIYNLLSNYTKYFK